MKKPSRKQQYIAGFTAGYFADKNIPFGMQYYSMLSTATEKAKKLWKKFKKQNK